MASKASRRAAAMRPIASPSSSSDRPPRSQGKSERPLSLLKSSDLEPAAKAGTATLNNGLQSHAGEASKEEEYNDFIECLGYPPPRI